MIENIVEKLNSLEFSPATIREVIQSAHTEKISRIFLEDEQLHHLAPVFDELGLEFFLSPKKYIFAQDTGKGGFSNSIRDLIPNSSPIGSFMVHIGRDKEKLFFARELDLNGDDKAFGNALGIPECCVKAFNLNSTEASVNQNDFTLFALSKDFFESDPWSINCAQYFGYGLVSHFPCSVNCKKTSEMAKSSARLLRDLAPNLALDFIKYQGYCYIYTEYDGVSAFKETSLLKENIWQYNPKEIESTSAGLLTQAIMKGNRIIVKTPFNFNIYNEKEEIMKVSSNSAAILFHKKSTDLI